LATGQRGQWGYLVMWEFEVQPGMEARFEEVYGPSGDWARLFEQDENYLGTELNRAQGPSPRYITLDFWVSEESYENFRGQRRREYETIDRQCDPLRTSERKLAAFVRFEAKSR
jgi:heme-degrading monooxygenase HmoA